MSDPKPCYRCKERPRKAQGEGCAPPFSSYCVECLSELNAQYEASRRGMRQPSVKKLREMATYPRDKDK